MARESLATTDDAAALRARFDDLQSAFNDYRTDAEQAEAELEADLKYAKEQLEEALLENQALRAQLEQLGEERVEQGAEIAYLQLQLEAIVGEKAELKQAVEAAEARLLLAQSHAVAGEKASAAPCSATAADPTPLRMVIDMKQRVHSLEEKLAAARISLAPFFSKSATLPDAAK